MESTFVYSRDGIFEVINKGRWYFERLLMEIANTKLAKLIKYDTR